MLATCVHGMVLGPWVSTGELPAGAQGQGGPSVFPRGLHADIDAARRGWCETWWQRPMGGRMQH